MEKYFTEEHKYTKPELIKFEKPVKVKLCELDRFLGAYKPFNCSDVYAYETFEYGDYGNYVRAIVESKTLDPKYCHKHTQAGGIYEAGEWEFAIRDSFWHYKEDYPFWMFRTNVGYADRKAFDMHDIEVEIEGVYVISWADKNEIEKQYNQKLK